MKMKTTEEWVKKFCPSRDIFAHLVYHPITEAEVKQIQLDAMREGMRRAAGMAWTEHSNEEKAEGMIELKTEILSAAEQLTEKDLGV